MDGMCVNTLPQAYDIRPFVSGFGDSPGEKVRTFAYDKRLASRPRDMT